MLVIAIDGACRRNGKPDCVSSGGVFIEQYEDTKLMSTRMLTSFEPQSTNQRGELLALRNALEYVCATGQSTQIVTDSEYIFNAMTKEWYIGWESRNWLTASGEPVKNSDLWHCISDLYKHYTDSNIEIVFYHIKGHCIPFGKVTANTLLSKDDTGAALLEAMYTKYDLVSTGSRKEALVAANELSLRNNGFKYTDEILRHFVVINSMADAIATRCVDIVDSLVD